MEHPNFNTKSIANSFRSLQDQLLARRNRSRKVIRQPTIRERDLGAALKNDDFSSFVLPTQTRGDAHSAGDSADYQNTHLLTEDVAENAGVLLFGIGIAFATLLTGNSGEHHIDVTSATTPGDFAAGATTCLTAHKQLSVSN